MNEKPVIFSAPMVRAILAGRKTMTRRLLRKAGIHNREKVNYNSPYRKLKPGDHLWVREAWVTSERFDPWSPDAIKKQCCQEAGYPEPWCPIVYTADGQKRWFEADFQHDAIGQRKRAAMHMPRWASRIILKVTAVKVERLQDITEEDAMAEGAIRYTPTQSTVSGRSLPPSEMWCFDQDPVEGTRLADASRPRAAFELLWDIINGAGAWDANPEIVAVSFAAHNRI